MILNSRTEKLLFICTLLGLGHIGSACMSCICTHVTTATVILFLLLFPKGWLSSTSQGKRELETTNSLVFGGFELAHLCRQIIFWYIEEACSPVFGNKEELNLVNLSFLGLIVFHKRRVNEVLSLFDNRSSLYVMLFVCVWWGLFSANCINIFPGGKAPGALCFPLYSTIYSW